MSFLAAALQTAKSAAQGTLVRVASVLLLTSTQTTEKTIICTDRSAGYCASYNVKEQTSNCFPAHVRVMTPSGFKRMDELNTNDELLGIVGGKETFSRLSTWLHYTQSQAVKYLSLTTQLGTITVSDHHNLASSFLEFAFACQVQSLLYAGRVISQTRVEAKGAYSPLTASNNYFVYMDGDTNHKVLAHCFSSVANPQNYEFAYRAFLVLWQMFESKEKGNEVHPAHQWLMSLVK